MSIYFADTSAFAKSYLQEVGTNWVRSWIDPQAGNLIVVSELGSVEFMSVLSRALREGRITQGDFNKLRSDFLFHFAWRYQVIHLSVNVITEARALVIRYPVRALDALQLASAITARKYAGPDTKFISADTRLLAAAGSEGFLTDNPHSYPDQ